MIITSVFAIGFGSGWLAYRFRTEISSLWKAGEERVGQEIGSLEKEIRGK